MLILAIDTSAVASAALISDIAMEGVMESFATEDTRSHAEVLAPGIEKLLADAGVSGADIDLHRHRRRALGRSRASFRDCDRPHVGICVEQTAFRSHEPGRNCFGSGRVNGGAAPNSWWRRMPAAKRSTGRDTRSLMANCLNSWTVPTWGSLGVARSPRLRCRRRHLRGRGQRERGIQHDAARRGLAGPVRHGAPGCRRGTAGLHSLVFAGIRRPSAGP